MKYFFVGYMGSGKSYCGREFANQQGYPFIDLDAYIGMMEQRHVSEIFRYKGEIYFRELETHYLQEVCRLFESFVLATGGGTPCFNNNMEYMNAQGHTIYVDTDIDILVERLSKNKRKRPLISDLKDTDLKDFILRHLEERLPYYRMAKEVVNNNN